MQVLQTHHLKLLCMINHFLMSSIKMKNDKRIKEMVKKLPEIIMMYLSQSNPNHNNQIPPNVKTIEIKGSISKIFLSIIGVEVK